MDERWIAVDQHRDGEVWGSSVNYGEVVMEKRPFKCSAPCKKILRLIRESVSLAKRLLVGCKRNDDFF